MAAHFEPVVDANCRLVAPPPTRWTGIGGYPKVAPYDMLGEQLHYSNPVKHGDSSHPVDLICIQESNLNSSFSFRIPGFSALRSDHTHYRSGILSRDATHASGVVIILARQGLSFSYLFTSSLSSLDSHSDYVGVDIFLNNFSSLSFHNVYAPPIRSSTNGRIDSFSLHSFLQKSFHSG